MAVSKELVLVFYLRKEERFKRQRFKEEVVWTQDNQFEL